MSDKPISDLRRRLLQDMTNRNFGAKTRHDYIRHIETFAKFLGRAPDSQHLLGPGERPLAVNEPLGPMQRREALNAALSARWA